jgi:hypothetical protein
MQMELMKHSIKMFADTHFRRILNLIIKEKINASSISNNNYL